MTWSSLHVFYHADRKATDRLLVQGIQPLVERLLAQQLVESWFFIRYWEGGPHVRLRLRGASADTVSQAADELRAHVRNLVAGDQRAGVSTDESTDTSADALGHTPAATPAGNLATPAGNPIDPRAFYAAVTPEPDALDRYGWIASGEVREIAYVPEIDRYGGPTGVAISEDLFQSSSRAALAAIQLAPDPQKRLLVALQMLLALVQAVDLPDLEAVGWLRGSVNMWPQIGPVSAEQAWRACNAAEREFVAKEEHWLKLRGWKLPDADSDGPNLPTYWARAVRDALACYRAAAAADQLTAPPLVILWSQIHMLHNRLGLTVAEEVYLEWLASLILARPHKHVAFSDDSTVAYDRLYHEQSKLTPYLLHEQMAQASNPTQDRDPGPRVSAGPWTQRVPLTRPEAPNQTVQHLEQVLLARRSEFRSYAGTMSAGELALLLELAVGRVPTEQLDIGEGRTVERKRRTHPSGGGRYPIMTYVLARKVEGVPPALYWFDVESHTLERVAAAPPIETLLMSSQMTSTMGSTAPVVVDARDAPVWLFPVADLSYQRKRYGLRSYRLVLQECGHMAQNVYLVATALGLTCITIGGYFDDLLSHALLLDGVNRAALYMIPIGRKP